jgi:hypothetical protein
MALPWPLSALSAGVGGFMDKRSQQGQAPIPPSAGMMLATSVLDPQLHQQLMQSEYSPEAMAKAPEAFKNAGVEAGFNLAGGAAGKALSKVGSKVLPAISEKIPKAFVKASLPEKATQAEKAAEKAALATGKELNEEVVDRGIVGGAKKLIRTGKAGMDATETHVKELLGKLPDQQTAAGRFEQLVRQAADKVSENVTTITDKNLLYKEAKDIVKLWGDRIKKGGFSSMWDYRKAADTTTKGKAAVQVNATVSRLNAQLAHEIRNEIASKSDDIAQAVKDKEFYSRLFKAAKSRASKAFFTRGDVIPIAVGLTGGIGTGIATGDPLKAISAGLGAAAIAKAPFEPGVTTPAAQVMKTGGKYVEKVGSTINKALPALSQLVGQGARSQEDQANSKATQQYYRNKYAQPTPTN